MSLLRYALVTVPLIVLLGTISGRLANSGYGNRWFDALTKPEIMPPGWMFGVAWTILYILLGLALANILHARGSRGRGVATAFFVAQMLLNYSWSPVFFAMHEARLALGIIIAMLVLASITAWLFARIRKSAGLLMLPYLAWLCFAAALNYQIIQLNPEAETLAPQGSSADIAL
jgi:tryptophan-rich sensory protein